MKKSPVPPASKSVLTPLALVSLALNASLLAWIFVPRPPPPAEPQPVSSAATAPAWSRELSPYAALGSFMAENNRVADLKWTPEQFAAFQDGFRASFEGRGLPLDEPAARLRDEMSARVQSMLEAERPNPVKDYFRFLREKEGVKETKSGLHYRITEEGTGEPPGPEAVVSISYAAGLPDGKSLPALSGTRVKVSVGALLPGLAEGVQLLRVGGKGLIYVPPTLSFREADWPQQLPREAPLVFFVELHDITAAP